MKTKNILLLFTLISMFLLTSIAEADGNLPIWTPQNQQSYPIPQLYPIGQNQQQNQPQQQWFPNPPQQNPQRLPEQRPPQNPQRPPEQKPQPLPYPGQGPYYDPWSGLYFYPIEDESQQPYFPYYQYQPYQPYYPYEPYVPYQPYNPGSSYSNVQVSKQWKNNGSINLTWTITNITNEFWDRKNIDIKCTSGCHLLTKPERTLWDIPYSVNRGGQLSFTVNIWRPMYGETMSFAIVAGSKTLYTFNIDPN